MHPVRARYRVGTTSFIHREGWLGNAVRLAGQVRDLEILLFDLDLPSGVPGAEEIAGLVRVKREAGLTYSVHAPLDVALASEDEVRRRASVEKVLRAIRIAAPLAPEAVIVHLYAGDRQGGPLPADVEGWRRRARRSLEEILESGVAAGALCLESLDAHFALAEPLLDALGISAALDVGHLARDGHPFDALLDRNLHRTRVVQWHGTDASGRDHRSLRFYPRADAVRLVRRLAEAGYSGALTLEVFAERDLEESLAVLAEVEAEALA